MKDYLLKKVIKYANRGLTSYEIVVMFAQLKRAGIDFEGRSMESLINDNWINSKGKINWKKIKLLKEKR